MGNKIFIFNRSTIKTTNKSDGEQENRQMRDQKMKEEQKLDQEIKRNLESIGFKV